MKVDQIQNHDIKDYIGEVVHNIDPANKGRIKVKVYGIFNNVDVDDLPWCSPDNRFAPGYFAVPRIGEIVAIKFDNNDFKMPLYGANVNLDKAFKDEIIKTTKESHNALSLIYSNELKTRIYSSVEDGLVISAGDKLSSNPLIRFDRNDGSIFISADNIYISNKGNDASEPAVRGETLKQLLDRLMHALISHNHISSKPGTKTSPPLSQKSNFQKIQRNLNKIKHTIKDEKAENTVTEPPSWAVEYPPAQPAQNTFQPTSSDGSSGGGWGIRNRSRERRLKIRSRKWFNGNGSSGVSSGGVDAGYINIALKQKENGVSEDGTPNTILEYFREINFAGARPDTHWCGAFVGYCLKKAGYKLPAGPAGASNWRNYGKEVAPESEGAIVVIDVRKGKPIAGSGSGFHVGFWHNGKCLGGNHGRPGKVSYASYKAKDVVAWRAPEGVAVNATGSGNAPVQDLKLTKNTEALVIGTYKAFIKAGFSRNQSLALTAEVGRENDFSPNLMFGNHQDLNTKVKGSNLGFFSWNSTRKQNLIKHLTSEGLSANMPRTQQSLDSMARFVLKESKNYSQSRNPLIYRFFSNPNINPEEAAKCMGTTKGYIGWAYGQETVTGRKFDWRAHDQRRRNWLHKAMKLTANV